MYKELKRIFTYYNAFVFPITIITSVILIFLIVVIPLARRTTTLYEEGNQLQEEVNSLKEKLALLDSYDEEELNTKLTEITSAIPTEKSVTTIMQTVEQAGAEMGVPISVISFEQVGILATESASVLTQTERQFGAFSIPFSVTIQASLDQIQQFLEKTASIRRFIRAKAFNVRFNQTEQITMQITFDAFYLPFKRKENTVLVPLSVSDEDFISQVSNMPNYSATFANDGDLLFPLGTNSQRNPFTF